MANKQVNAEEALEDIQKQVERCHKSKHYMAAFWCIEEDRLHFLGKITQEFPTADFLSAVTMLAVDCTKEVEELQSKNDDPPPPLPLASFVKDIQKKTVKEQ